MRFFILFLLLFSLCLVQNLPAQPVDSLARAIDSHSRAIDQQAKELQRWKDSIEREQIFRNLEQHGQPLDAFLQDMREQEAKKKRQIYFRIGFGALALIVLVVTLIRRRRR